MSASVGGGAVGIPLARELTEAGQEVVLLESGSHDFDQATQDLYAGVESGTVLGPDTEYLTETRNRYYGGTTNTWNGWCRPLDPEDLEVREWVADSGWPIEQEEMQAFHRRAARVVQITPFDKAEGATPTEILPIGPEAQIENSFLHCSAPTRFAERFKKAMRHSKNARVLFNSNAVEILDQRRSLACRRDCRGIPRRQSLSCPLPRLCAGHRWYRERPHLCWPPTGCKRRGWATVTIWSAAISWIIPSCGSRFW